MKTPNSRGVVKPVVDPSFFEKTWLLFLAVAVQQACAKHRGLLQIKAMRCPKIRGLWNPQIGEK